MDVFWETEIFRVTSVFTLCSLRLTKKEVSILFLRLERVVLLEHSCFSLLQKTCFHFSYSGVNLVHNPVISAASAGSAAFLPACPVLCSVVPTPAPASLLCTAILCGITPSLLCSLHRLLSGAAGLCLAVWVLCDSRVVTGSQ